MEETKEETTTIRIKLSTKEKLEKTGVYGDSHDTIINKLLNTKR